MDDLAPSLGQIHTVKALREGAQGAPREAGRVVHGDEVRKGLSRDLGLSKEDQGGARQEGVVCCESAGQERVIAILALISPPIGGRGQRRRK